MPKVARAVMESKMIMTHFRFHRSTNVPGQGADDDIWYHAHQAGDGQDGGGSSLLSQVPNEGKADQLRTQN